MTNLQTEYFLRIASTKSVSRAAEELFVSSPAVSKQIALLEQELQFKLFFRGPRGMELTPEGQVMFDYCTAQKTALDSALKKARNASYEVESLHLGLMSGWAIQKQIAQIQTFLRSSSKPVNLVPHSYFDPSNADRLDSGELDAALCLGCDLFDTARATSIGMLPLAKIHKIFLFSSHLPISSKADLSPQDLRDLPLLTFSANVRPSAQYENLRLCDTLGFTPRQIIRDNPEDVFFGAGIGEGFMIGDEWLDRKQLPDYAFLRVEDFHTIYLIWPEQSQHPGLQMLRTCCEQEIDWTVK